MVRHTSKILQQMLQDFYSVSDHFMTFRSKGLTILTRFNQFIVQEFAEIEDQL